MRHAHSSCGFSCLHSESQTFLLEPTYLHIHWHLQDSVLWATQIQKALNPLLKESYHLIQQSTLGHISKKSSNSKRYMGVPVMAQWLMNPTRNREVVGLIPGLAQWVKDLSLR